MNINKDTLVRKIFASDRMTNYTIRNNKLTMDLIHNIYEELESQIIQSLSEVDETNTLDNPVVVRVFEGITLSSYFKPQKETILNFAKEEGTTTLKPRVGVKVSATRYIKEKITKLNEEFRKSK